MDGWNLLQVFVILNHLSHGHVRCVRQQFVLSYALSNGCENKTSALSEKGWIWIYDFPLNLFIHNDFYRLFIFVRRFCYRCYRCYRCHRIMSKSLWHSTVGPPGACHAHTMSLKTDTMNNIQSLFLWAFHLDSVLNISNNKSCLVFRQRHNMHAVVLE